MIVAVSIVDKHTGGHVGTYMFEVPYSGDSHFDVVGQVCVPENEDMMRPYVGRLLHLEDMQAMEGGVVRGDGSPYEVQEVTTQKGEVTK